MKYLPWLLCLLVGLTGCCGVGEPDQVVETVRVKGKMRVMMHSTEHYTVFVELPDGKVAQHSFRESCLSANPEITHGLSPEQPMSIEYQVVKRAMHSETCDKLIAIHLHSVTEINGGGWDHGKQGKGQTNVIQ